MTDEHSPVGIGKEPIPSHVAGRPGHVLEAGVLVTVPRRHDVSVLLLEGEGSAQGLYGTALDDARVLPQLHSELRAGFGGVENRGGNGVSGRSVAVERCEMAGCGVVGRRRVGSPRGVRGVWFSRTIRIGRQSAGPNAVIRDNAEVPTEFNRTADGIQYSAVVGLGTCPGQPDQDDPAGGRKSVSKGQFPEPLIVSHDNPVLRLRACQDGGVVCRAHGLLDGKHVVTTVPQFLNHGPRDVLIGHEAQRCSRHQAGRRWTCSALSISLA